MSEERRRQISETAERLRQHALHGHSRTPAKGIPLTTFLEQADPEAHRPDEREAVDTVRTILGGQVVQVEQVGKRTQLK